MNAEREGIRSIQAETGLSYQQARALNRLRRSGKLRSPAGTLPNPAVVESWYGAISDVLRASVIYDNVAVGPKIVIDQSGMEFYSRQWGQSAHDEFWALPGSVLEKEALWADRRGFASSFSDSNHVTASLNGRRQSLDLFHDGEDGYRISGFHRWFSRNFSAEDLTAALKIIDHDQVGAYNHVSTVPNRLLTRVREQDRISYVVQRPLDMLAWLPLLDLLPGWRMALYTSGHVSLSSDPDETRYTLGAQDRWLFSEPLRPGYRIDVRQYGPISPDPAKETCLSSAYFTYENDEQLAREIRIYTQSRGHG